MAATAVGTPAMPTASQFNPANLWDQPLRPSTQGEDLSELSVQTELFARGLLNGPAGSGGGIPLDHPPMQAQGMSSGLLSKAPGAPTTRSSPAPHQTSPLAASPPGMAPGALSWNPMMLPSKPSPSSSSSSFGLDSISTSPSPSTVMDPTPGGPAAYMFGTGSSAQQQQHEQSIMQRLLAERRKRQEDYHKKVKQETWEWPGFGPAPSGGSSPPGLPPSSSHPPGLQAAGPDSLWDNPENAPWIASTAAASTASNSLWSAPSWGNAAVGAPGSRGGSIWGSSEQAASTPTTTAPSPPVTSTYDPFASNIWNPSFMGS